MRGSLRRSGDRRIVEIPPHPNCFAISTSPRKRGEVMGKQSKPPMAFYCRPVPDRPCQRGVAVPGRVGPVDHLRRDADRQFRAWRLLHARRLSRVHADRTVCRRAWVLGRHCRSCARGRRRRRHRRDGAAAADLSFAGTVPTAGDVRPDADGRGPRGAGLGPERSARPPRARLQGSRRVLRPEHPEL